MALVTPVDLIAMARVNYDSGTGLAAYAFNNGFEGSTPPGAVAGSPAIQVTANGNLVLFLDGISGVDPTRWTIRADVTICGRGATPAIAVPTVEYQPTLAGDYAAVDASSALRIRAYVPNTGVLLATGFSFDISVYRNPETIL